MSLAIVSTLFLAVVAGLATTVATSGRNARSTGADAVAVGVAERLKTMDYRACATAADLESDYDVFGGRYLPAGATLDIISVRYLAAGGSTTFAAAGAPCSTDRGAQLVRLRVGLRDSSSEIEVVVRNPGARP